MQIKLLHLRVNIWSLSLKIEQRLKSNGCFHFQRNHYFGKEIILRIFYNLVKKILYTQHLHMKQVMFKIYKYFQLQDVPVIMLFCQIILAKKMLSNYILVTCLIMTHLRYMQYSYHFIWQYINMIQVMFITNAN